MKVGTKSLLFGVHQFLWHPITVWLAWKHLYGWPSLVETVCIIIHDWGYWGCADMDGAEGHRHPERSAVLAGALMGEGAASLVLLHSRHFAQTLKLPPSRLCWADKYSMLYEPEWFYLLRARLSGEIREYRRNAARKGFIGGEASDRQWLRKLRDHLARMSREQAACLREAA